MGTDEVVRHLQPEVVPRNMVAEVEFAARRDWDDPTAEVEVDFEFTGRELRGPTDGRQRLLAGFTTVGPQQELTSDHSWVTPTGEDWVLVVSPKR